MKPNWIIDFHKGGTGNLPISSIGLASFVIKHHYSKSLPRGTKYVFSIRKGKKIIGVSLFGTPVGRNCQAKYSSTGKLILELKRLCLIDKTPKNSESWFIARCLRLLKKENLFDGILSYADPEQGHQGVIYKASNFNYYGTQSHGSPKYMIGSKRVSPASTGIKKLISSGKKLKMVYDKPKHIFYYPFER